MKFCDKNTKMFVKYFSLVHFLTRTKQKWMKNVQLTQLFTLLIPVKCLKFVKCLPKICKIR